MSMRLKKPNTAARMLEVLSESPIPVPTPDLIALCCTGLSHPRARAHVTLARLLADGLVRRGYRSIGGRRLIAVWSLATPVTSDATTGVRQ